MRLPPEAHPTSPILFERLPNAVMRTRVGWRDRGFAYGNQCGADIACGLVPSGVVPHDRGRPVNFRSTKSKSPP